MASLLPWNKNSLGTLASLSFWGFTLGSHPGRVQRANHCNKTHVDVTVTSPGIGIIFVKLRGWCKRHRPYVEKFPSATSSLVRTRSEATYQLVEILVGEILGNKLVGNLEGYKKQLHRMIIISLVPKNYYTQKHHHSTNISSNSKRNV